MVRISIKNVLIFIINIKKFIIPTLLYYELLNTLFIR
jgi:hypothetical protein